MVMVRVCAIDKKGPLYRVLASTTLTLVPCCVMASATALIYDFTFFNGYLYFAKDNKTLYNVSPVLGSETAVL